MTNLSTQAMQSRQSLSDCYVTVVSSVKPSVLSKKLSWDSSKSQLNVQTSAHMSSGKAEVYMRGYIERIGESIKDNANYDLDIVQTVDEHIVKWLGHIPNGKPKEFILMADGKS